MGGTGENFNKDAHFILLCLEFGPKLFFPVWVVRKRRHFGGRGIDQIKIPVILRVIKIEIHALYCINQRNALYYI